MLKLAAVFGMVASVLVFLYWKTNSQMTYESPYLLVLSRCIHGIAFGMQIYIAPMYSKGLGTATSHDK
ncbi:MAG: hypothetical protein P4M11_04620 [Candidatus Pacebacteria bacterium]|nr:hypothetical protein [Candidatus Paceibacterota bacterium]